MKSLITSVFVFWAITVYTQNKEVLYGLVETPQATMLNPGSAFFSDRYLGIPFLSQIHINGGSSGVSAFDIFQESQENINDRIRNKIFELKPTDFFTTTQQIDIINFGWKNEKEIFFSGGIYQEFDFVFYFPKDLAVLAWEGNANYIGKEFDLGELNTNGDLLMVYHFGAKKQISKKLTLGGRAKIYSSMLSYRSTNNKGKFVTRISETNTNIYEHIVSDANITVNTSGIASLSDLDNASQVTRKVLGRAFFGGNLGVGVDLGATYKINENWTTSASVLDVGAIFHKKDVETYQVKGNYTLNGIELLFPPYNEEGSSYYEDLLDEIEAEFAVDTLKNSYSQMRPIKTYVSAHYNFGRALGGGKCNCLNMGENQTYNQAVGFQYYSMFRPKGPQMAATLFYYRRFSDFFSVKATYTVDSYSYSNIGFGLVSNIGKVNFFITANNLLWYENIAKAKSVSLQLGFTIIFDDNE